MKMEELSHPNSIWTWSGFKTKKGALWIPYLLEVTKLPRKKNHYTFSFNGGELVVDLCKIDFILIYGANTTCSLPLDFLDDLNSLGIALAIHRRNKSQPYFFTPTSGSNYKDVLTNQIAFRSNEKKRVYVARTLIRARFESFTDFITISETTKQKLMATRSVAEVRVIEAGQTKRLWENYYGALDIDVTRREKHVINAALDACSTFMAGIILRWVHLHKLAPTHGYLHESTNYISLIYDLVEPYRYIFEKAVYDVFATESFTSDEEWIAASIKAFKDALAEEVYVPTFQVTVTRKNLLHAIVLALRSYLMNETARFVVPMEGERKGGRPVKAAFSIPGAK